MSHAPATSQPVSLTPDEGWHCTHIYYSFDRLFLQSLGADEHEEGERQLTRILDGTRDGAPQRLQTSIVSGHKADFGLMMMDPDPICIDRVHQELLGSALGPGLQAMYSFISLTEVSEYVPSVDQYAQRLIAEGETVGSPAYEAKVKAYAGREPMMRKQRLTPDFPDWPATCFYPMNKIRDPQANWFTTPFSKRNRLMSEHAKSGMAFAGKVTQLITVGVGLEDWEWGVTLWARNPAFLKDIVYRMRFDEASARYAEFGPFYTSYVVSPRELVDHCCRGAQATV